MGYEIYGFPLDAKRPKIDMKTATEVEKMHWHEEMAIWETTTRGAYFRAQYDYWKELVEKLQDMNETLLNGIIDMSGWEYNDGAGASANEVQLLVDTIKIHWKKELESNKTLQEFLVFLENCNGFYIL